MGLFKLIFTLGVNRKPLEKGLKDSQKELENFGSKIKGQMASVFTVGAVMAYAKSIHETVNRVKDLSEQFGITTDEVQKTDYALGQSGMAIEDMATALASLQRTRREAVEGGTTGDDALKTFERYGITLKDLNNPQLRAYDLFLKLADAMSKATLTAREQSDMMDILGPKAMKLSNVMASLSSVKPLKIISESDIKAIDDAAKSFERMSKNAQSVAATPLAGIYNNISDIIEKAKAGDIGGLYRKFNPLTRFNDQFFGYVKAGKERQFTAAGQTSIDIATMMAGLFNGSGMGGGIGLWEEGKNDKADKTTKFSPINFRSRPSDSLVSVGNFLGGDPAAGVRQQVTQIIQRLERIEQHTKKTADNALIIRK